MRFLFLTILLIFCFHIGSYGNKIDASQALRHVKTAQFQYDFYVSLDDKKIKYKDTISYYWYKSQKIHHTQGNSEGNILNGSYAKFYHSGQLAEKGQFEYGLKNGEWKTWYKTGVAQTIFNYNSGLLSGIFIQYDTLGNRVLSGSYKNGLINGEFIDHVKGDTALFKKGVKKIKSKRTKEEGADDAGFLKKLFKSDRKKKNKREKKEKNKDKEPFLKRIFGKKSKSEVAPKQ